MMNRLVGIALIVVVMVAAISANAFAAKGDIMMAGFLLFRLRCPGAGYTLDQRIEAVQARANDLLVLDGFDLSTIRVEKVGNDAILYANNKVLVTVDQCTARTNRTTPVQLANVWAARLREIYPNVVPKMPEIPESD